MYVDLPGNKLDSNNSDWCELPSNEMLFWNEALDRLLPQRQIGSKENPKEKFSGMVQFWREWNPQLGHGVWNKVYRNGHKLQAFNQWEVEFLAQLALHSVGQTYHPVSLVREGTASDPRLLGGTRPAQYLIQTRDAGPTLADWLRMPVRSGNQLTPVAHCLVSPENFLLMAQSLLRALENIHAMNFIHCDLHAGNISIPAKVMQPPVDGKNADSALSFQLNLPELTLIDFGFSINCRKTPYTTLPFAQDGYRARISPHLKSVLATIEEQTTKQLPKEKHWDEVWLDANFWQSWIGASPLDLIKTIDWREDLYQLGYLLADIRDGTGPDAMHLGGRILCKSRQAEVNTLIDELPEQLMRWGEDVGTAAPQKPHRDYLNRIDAALTLARHNGDTAIATFTLNIKDYDSIPSSPLQPETAVIPVRQRAAPETLCNQTTANPSQPFKPWSQQSGVQAKPVQTFAVGQRFKERPFLPDMVVLSNGRFIMGSEATPESQPEHTVQLRYPANHALAVASTALSFEQWDAAVRAGGVTYRPDDEGVGRGDLPVVQVSWLDAQAYLAWVNQQTSLDVALAHLRYRLLTEAEWEYAARAGTRSRYWWGDEFSAKHALLQTANSSGQPQSVQAGSANPWGLLGMIGNVWEWVEDSYHPDYQGAPGDGSAWVKGDNNDPGMSLRQMRGGSWGSPASPAGVAARAWNSAQWRSPFIGIRLARLVSVR